MSKTRIWIGGMTVAAVGAAALMLSGPSGAGDAKALKGSIDQIAAALKKGDKAGAKSMADALAKKTEEIAEVMDLFKPRKKGGFGVGEKPGSVEPDHIDQLYVKLSGPNPPAAGTLTKNAAALEQMGYRTAAMALITLAKAPDKNQGKKTKKDWVAWATDMHDGALAMAAAAKSKNVADIKSSASKAYSACANCHAVFR
jgi:hypothetical protein